MNVTETIRTFLEFFGDRGHQIVPSSSLVPPDDDPVLFTTAGMHPLTRYLEGRPPSAGQAAGRRAALPAHHRSGRGWR
jgi:alanyl-tRNA synthetase